MVSISISSLLAALDASVVSTAMPSIIQELGSSQGYLWIANAYLLTMTAFTPIFGQTADIFGRRALTLIAILCFAIGSAISGPAPTLSALVVGRAVQGIGAAGLNTIVEVVVCDLVPLRERGKFMGFIFAIFGVGTSIGPVIGGVLAARVTWRWVFYINLPLAGFSLALVAISMGALPSTNHKGMSSLATVDFSGNLLIVATITSILLALTWGGGEEPWSSWKTIVPLFLGLAGLPLYVLIESRVAQPTTPLRLFSNRTSLAAFGLTFTHHILVYWTIFTFPIYFQGVLRESALGSGVGLLPSAVGSMPFAIIAGALLSKVGRYRPLHFAGFGFFALAFGLYTRLDANSTTGYWVGTQIFGAAGIGIITSVTLPAILAPLPETDVAVATATWAFMRGFGTIWGAAIPLCIFNSRVNQLATSRLSDPELRMMLYDGGAYALAPAGAVYAPYPEFEDAIRGIYVDSLRLCWQVGLGFALLGFLIAFLPKEVPMRTELETEFGLNKMAGGQGSLGEKSDERIQDGHGA